MISVDDRPALPLFGSTHKAEAFLSSTNFGPDWKPVEVSGAGLLAVLESYRGQVEYVALNPPPASSGGMKASMSSSSRATRRTTYLGWAAWVGTARTRRSEPDDSSRSTAGGTPRPGRTWRRALSR